MMTKYIIITIILANIQIAFSQNINNWQKDIELIKKELPEKHINLFTFENKNDFNKNLDKVLLKITNNNLNKLEAQILIQQTLVKLGDSHTGTDWLEKISQLEKLPFYTQWFKDGIYIVMTTNNNNDILGKKIIRINGFPINQIIDSIGTLLVKDNNATIKAWSPYFLNNVFLLNYFKFSKIQDTTYYITVISNNDTLTHDLSMEKLTRKNIVKIRSDKLAFCWKNMKYDFKEKYFEQDSIYYILYNKCVHYSDKFNDFKRKVFNTIDTKPINKVVFDMRFNRGGDSGPGSELIYGILERDSINKFDIFVITGHITFSSAIIHTTQFINKSKAIIVGEEPMGVPNSYGDIRYFELPYSKIKIFYSTKHFNLLNTKENTIHLDKKIEATYSDFKIGIDPVFEWIKKQ